MKNLSILTLSAIAMMLPGLVQAQTAIQRPTPASKARFSQTASAAKQASMGLEAGSELQAKRQANGDFGTLQRSVSLGGQIQEAWSLKGKNQGVHVQEDCGDCVYKVRLREYMASAIVLPEGVNIASVDLGDTDRFDVKRRTKNILVVKPLGAGVDSSMQVYTTDDEVFSFYLRSEMVHSKHTPDLSFKIRRRSASGIQVINFADGAPTEDLATKNIPTGVKDFLKTATFDPSKIRGFDSYKLWGSDDLKPEQVYRDDNFTYIQYGEKWSDLELPTAYVVVDDIDELVNTRVVGTTFIVESTHRLITLKSGQAYMCVQYKGD
ncbi:TrbG/VirB9 family P-type conjugative transfer protein [Cohaesibacter celericrescens]|uniref:Conjugal transfer protein TrbG n=1 Tax=Cohaesibacter celericrescens TaxID=2067669 RepID=A0A2N5XRN7_9HYPH|nr:TrbG/VirB9 family P-type conjugative transfer protein [Cohaesibacter celericrescens]PLW77186.1 hypothetical protein C0081_10965 [Cohaesibacter celericrescens]